MKRLFILTLLALWAAPAPALALDPALAPEAKRLLEQGRRAQPERARLAERLGARIEPTSDGRSFVLVWTPKEPVKGWVVTLHGHGSWAFDELALWQPHLEGRGLGLAALQWWFGRGEAMPDYYPPEHAYREIDQLLRRLGASPKSALLHGFSRGAANIYGVAALDIASANHFFGLVLANAGGAAPDFPVNRNIESGRFGSRPFASQNWITFCGGRDENPERDGCPAMRRAGTWVVKHGATLLRTIEDPSADHGGFHRQDRHVRTVLDLFQGKRVAP
ncbi:MAG: hypothetical protein HZC25_10510 [Rhodospirillales bacterium]|nr:hypothetical protein [Rhodospirillales bacterium]